MNKLDHNLHYIYEQDAIKKLTHMKSDYNAVGHSD